LASGSPKQADLPERAGHGIASALQQTLEAAVLLGNRNQPEDARLLARLM
jgi:hypothetical protein